MIIHWTLRLQRSFFVHRIRQKSTNFSATLLYKYIVSNRQPAIFHKFAIPQLASPIYRMGQIFLIGIPKNFSFLPQLGLHLYKR